MNDSFDWKTYIFSPVNDPFPMKIECPSIGVGIEYCLAVRGMLSYDYFLVQETEEPPEETKQDVNELFGRMSLDFIERLDSHHIWKTI